MSSIVRCCCVRTGKVQGDAIFCLACKVKGILREQIRGVDLMSKPGVY